MEVANASMYDGSSAVPEAAMMAVRITGRDQILASKTRASGVSRSASHLRAAPGDADCGIWLRPANSGALDLKDLESKLNDKVAAVIVQSPNFFGIVEDVKAAAALAHKHGALLIMVFTEAVSLGLLEPPKDAGHRRW